ncbi:alpha/beta hydrolase [Streptomyces thioluteus]|uniref:Alpha/beta hydrolase n=1 Tax=Streptomyces thioluteus TaxID=66431 RepID=A0ABN3WCY5_STRTU
MRFTDEDVPDWLPLAPASDRPGLPPGTREALALAFPGRDAILGRLAELAERQPADRARLEEFTGLVRTLVSPRPREADRNGAEDGAWIRDTDSEPIVPVMFTQSAVEVCDAFATALESPGPARPGPVRRRAQAGVARRARVAAPGHVLGDEAPGRRRRPSAGLGPAMGELAARAPELRVHLAGHSFGARLVSFAPGGLPDGVRVQSLTLLQGAFSHYAFTPRLPFAPGRSGVLRDAPERVAGTVACCWSRHDTALGTLYPLASRLSGDSESLLGLDESRWGAMGHDGMRAVPDCAALSLADALAGALPASGCANIDAGEVVRRGGPPSGAHSDICHAELARVVLMAGRGMR